MYTSKRNILLAAGLTLLLGGCINNDLPYPRVEVKFTEFTVGGQVEPAVIDTDKRTVTIALDEEADLSNVELLAYTIDPAEARVGDGELPARLDLTAPRSVTLSLYQDYEWTISATQAIERYITVEPQMGEPVIDVPGRRVIVYVSGGADLSALDVTSIKLGRKGSVMEPDLEGQKADFTRPVEVTVTDRGAESRWTIYAETVDATVTLSSADAWTQVAWLKATALEGRDNGFEYRVSGSDSWTRVPDEYITSEGGTLTCRLIHLAPSTTYEVRAFSDGDVTAAQQITTGAAAQLPNADFDRWTLDGKVWNPWGDGDTPFWDTGNKGATTLGTSNSQPTTDTPSGAGNAAELKSEFKGVGSLGKLAAGNIFSGVYVRTDGTNGILNFGQEFTQRPTRMTAQIKYTTAPISHVGSDEEYSDWKGRPDTAQVYIALTDWDTPLEVRTNPRNRQLFDPSDPAVIAYGAVSFGETIENWTQISVDLEYRSTSRVPKYVLVVCTASKYGDYFVGASGSVLTIDDLNLEYDY